jgi:hypothetical protein
MSQSSSPLSSESLSPKRPRIARSTRNFNPRYTKSQFTVWKRRPETIIQPLALPVQSERDPKRIRGRSDGDSTLSPEPIEQVPKTANRPNPRHSLPKQAAKKPRPSTGPIRSQPIRGDTQPSTARATPNVTPDERTTTTPRNLENLPAKTLRAARPLDQHAQPDTEIRNEASMIIAAHAAKHRELLADSLPALSSPNDEVTPSSRGFRPMSPLRTGQTDTQIVTPADDDIVRDESSDDFDTTFDADLEKVKDAYRHGIRPCNNPYAPQQYSVPVYGLEDANPPEWLENQPSTIVTAPRRDRVLPTDPIERAHRQGFDGLNPELAADAAGFVKVNPDFAPPARMKADYNRVIYCTSSPTGSLSLDLIETLSSSRSVAN